LILFELKTQKFLLAPKELSGAASLLLNPLVSAAAFRAGFFRSGKPMRHTGAALFPVPGVAEPFIRLGWACANGER